MLTKRTQILFEENLWRKLVRLSQAQKISVGKLVREAVRERYEDTEKMSRRQKAIEATLKERIVSKTKIDYKELVNYGRKF